TPAAVMKRAPSVAMVARKAQLHDGKTHMIEAYCCGVILPVSPTSFQRAISSVRNLRNSSPLLATTSKPVPSKFDLISDALAAAAISASSLARTAGGRPLGAAAACQE